MCYALLLNREVSLVVENRIYSRYEPFRIELHGYTSSPKANGVVCVLNHTAARNIIQFEENEDSHAFYHLHNSLCATVAYIDIRHRRLERELTPCQDAQSSNKGRLEGCSTA